MSEVTQQDRDAAARVDIAKAHDEARRRADRDATMSGFGVHLVQVVGEIAASYAREEAARNARGEALSKPVLQLVREARVSALKEACLAVASERLNDVTGDAGDEAYNQAIGDALAAIRALGESQS